MKVLVFIPGTMGTRLYNSRKEELWPPEPLETKFGYKRMDKLMGDDVVPGDIIENVLCFDFYGSLFKSLAELEYIPGGVAKRLIKFPYDWRLDLETTAAALAGSLDQLDAQQVEEIHLVAHSMGGLIARLVLESGRYTGSAWFSKIKSFVALATPHLGAPLALARVLGLDSDMGISKEDFRKFANDRRYPSGYQLLPAPGEAACWNLSDPELSVADIYDEQVARKLQLNLTLLARARFVHDTFQSGGPPRHVRYFYFAGTGHETLTRVNVFEDSGAFPAAQMRVTHTEAAGDGTVPLWSALPRVLQKQVVVNEHAHVFTGMPFKLVFYRLLGGDLGAPLQGILDQQPPEPLRLSLPRPVITAGKSFELLLVPPSPTVPIDGTLFLQALKDDGSAAEPPRKLFGVQYIQGPPVSSLRFSMPPLAQPGWYQFIFSGAPMNSPPLQFAVSQV